MSVALSDYLSGGYLLVRSGKISWEPLQARGLLPDTVVSLSRCLASTVEVTWGWIPGDPQAALDFGIAEDRLEDFLAWCRRDYAADMDLLSMFYTVEAARRFVRRFQVNTIDLYLIGAGLHKTLAASKWRAPMDEADNIGIEKRISQRVPLETGGQNIGFEVVGFSYHVHDCSWLCSNLNQDMFDLYGIRPNQYGLIDTYAEAKQVLDWINEDPKTRAEPVPYDVWLLVSYPLTAEGEP